MFRPKLGLFLLWNTFEPIIQIEWSSICSGHSHVGFVVSSYLQEIKNPDLRNIFIYFEDHEYGWKLIKNWATDNTIWAINLDTGVKFTNADTSIEIWLASAFPIYIVGCWGLIQLGDVIWGFDEAIAVLPSNLH